MLVLIGETYHDSHTYDNVKDFIEQHGMNSWVTIVPFVEDVREYEAAADFLVLPSNREALGRCVVEAMSMELPVIVNSTGGSCEFIKHQENGFIFEDEDTRELARSMIQLLADAACGTKMSKAARTFAQDNLDSRIAARRVMELYDQAFEEGLRGGNH